MGAKIGVTLTEDVESVYLGSNCIVDRVYDAATIIPSSCNLHIHWSVSRRLRKRDWVAKRD